MRVHGSSDGVCILSNRHVYKDERDVTSYRTVLTDCISDGHAGSGIIRDVAKERLDVTSRLSIDC